MEIKQNIQTENSDDLHPGGLLYESDPSTPVLKMRKRRMYLMARFTENNLPDRQKISFVSDSHFQGEAV